MSQLPEIDTAERMPGSLNAISETCQAEQTDNTSMPSENRQTNGQAPVPVPILWTPHNPAPNRKVSSEEILDSLHEFRGGIYRAARQLGVTVQCIRDRARVDPQIAYWLKAYRGIMVDAAEYQLADAVDQGDAWAVQFTLKTQGRHRGYVERTETRSQTTIKGALVQFLQPAQAAGLLGLPTSALSDPPALALKPDENT